MDWREAWSLTRTLVADGSSRLGAAVAGWAHPRSPEWWALADTYDLLGIAHLKRPKPYPRPTDARPTRIGRATRPQHEIRAALRARGHK